MRLFAATLLIAVGTTNSSQAGVIISFTEMNGGGVKADYSGSINLAALGVGTDINNLGLTSSFSPGFGIMASQSTGAGTLYEANANFVAYGSTAFATFDSTSGDMFAVFGDLLAVNQGYTSGDTISGTAIKSTGNFASLGLSTGTFTTVFSSLDSQGNEVRDFVSVVVGNVIGVVPEPASASLWGIGLAGLALTRRRRS